MRSRARHRAGATHLPPRTTRTGRIRPRPWADLTEFAVESLALPDTLAAATVSNAALFAFLLGQSPPRAKRTAPGRSRQRPSGGGWIIRPDFVLGWPPAPVVIAG